MEASKVQKLQRVKTTDVHMLVTLTQLKGLNLDIEDYILSNTVKICLKGMIYYKQILLSLAYYTPLSLWTRIFHCIQQQ